MSSPNPTPYHSSPSRSSPPFSRSLPKRNSSFNSKARQQAYLDQKRRQRVLGGSASLVDSSHHNNDNSNNHEQHSDESSYSHHDPIHILPMESHSLPHHTSSGLSLDMSNSAMSLNASSASFHSPEVRNTVSSIRRKFSSRKGGSFQRRRARYEDEDASESESAIDPLHIMTPTVSGITPLDAKASATCQASKFFLTPPERLQVDQSVNLMDVETGNYDFELSQRAEKIRAKFANELNASSQHATHTTPPSSRFGTSFLHNTSRTPTNNNRASHRTSFSQFLSHTLHLSNSAHDDTNGGRRSRMMSIMLDANSPLAQRSAEITITRPGPDVELGNSSKKKSQRRRNKRQKALDFPDGYDPNLWEKRAFEAKSQPLLVDSEVSSTSSNEELAQAKRRARKARRQQRRRERLRKLRPGRVALVVGGVFIVLTIVLLTLVLTGQLMLHKWRQPNASPPSSSSSSSEQTTIAMEQELPLEPIPPPVERNHSYLDFQSLPEFSRLMVKQPHTPQYKAFEYLKHDPKTTIVTANSAGDLQNFTLHPIHTLAAKQKFALATLYYRTEGETAWEHTPDPWMDGDLNECDWFGMDEDTINYKDLEFSVCNRYHQLHALPLRGVGLKGQLPTEELILLSTLRHVNVAYNQLTGSLDPEWFQHWKNLEHLSVEHNRYTGTLPSELGLLTNSNGLRTLKFNHNEITGTIPSELGQLMDHLITLEAKSNRLSGSIPTELGGLADHRSLERLGLDDNQLTGLIPSELGLLSNLEALLLHYNPGLAQQTLPQEICDLPNLSLLTVDCDIVTCPDSCQCSCFDSSNAIPWDEASPAVAAKSAGGSSGNKKEHSDSSSGAAPSPTSSHGSLRKIHRGDHAKIDEEREGTRRYLRSNKDSL